MSSPPRSSASDEHLASEHVRLEADVAAQAVSESVWIGEPSAGRLPVVLIVEEDDVIRARVASRLRDVDPEDGRPLFHVLTAGEASVAVEEIRRRTVDLVVCGRLHSRVEAVELYDALRRDPQFGSGADLHIASAAGSGSLLRFSNSALLGEAMAELVDAGRWRGP